MRYYVSDRQLRTRVPVLAAVASAVKLQNPEPASSVPMSRHGYASESS
jgi:hypothetical protein